MSAECEAPLFIAARGKDLGGADTAQYLPVVAVLASDWNYPPADSKGKGKSPPEKRKIHPFLVTGDILYPRRGQKFHRLSDCFHPLGSNMQKWKSEGINMRR